VVYGVSADFAMSRLDDEVHPEMHLFVEDREAEVLLREILASSGDTGGLLQRIAINAVGASNVVAMLGDIELATMMSQGLSLSRQQCLEARRDCNDNVARLGEIAVFTTM
jgi:hypothetical protein